MKCEWCTSREAVWWGRPWWGPQSRMCEPCRERVCMRDVQAGRVVYMGSPFQEGQDAARDEKHA